jgi:outer membrane lipoprotein carrier protein
MKRLAAVFGGLAILIVVPAPRPLAARPQEGSFPPGAVPSSQPVTGKIPGAQTLAETAPAAEEAVAKLQKALQAVTTLQARFEQLHYSMAISEPLRERGDLFLEKPDKMRWAYKDPQDKVFLYQAGVLEMYLPDEKQLTRTPVSEEALRSDIFGLLLGTVTFRDAYVVENNPFPTDAARVRQVKLTPKAEGEFSHILLEIDETTWLLRRAIFLEWAGNKREFIFSRVRTGGRIPAATFTLRVPPGTEIIDDTEGIRRQGR